MDELAGRLAENHRRFLGFLERRLGDRALAEDLLQDAFVKTIEKGRSVRDDESAVAWFYRMLRNAVIDHHRRSSTRSRALDALAREMRDAAVPPPELKAGICTCIGELVSELKPEYAAAIRRVDVDELPVRGYAAEAGISSNNASVRLFRAREALRREVLASCRTCAQHGCVDCTCKRG